MSRDLEWLASAGGDILGMDSIEDAERVISAVEAFAATDDGLLSLGLDDLHRLYVRNAPYFVLLRVTDERVIVERVVRR